MTQPKDWKLVLTGAYAGKTVELNGYNFTDGILALFGAPKAVEGVIRYMGKSYQAYLEGSDELDKAQERDRLYEIEQTDKRAEEAETAELEALRTAKELDEREARVAELRELRALQAQKDDTDGKRDNSGKVRPAPGDDSGDSGFQSDGSRSSETTAVNGGGSNETSEGDSGSVPSGDGHADSRVPDSETGSRGDKPAEGSLEVDTKLVKAIHALDPDNDEHWTGVGLPAMTAIELAYGSTGVTRKDVTAAIPEWNREKAQEAEDLKELTA